jgi:penicillin amidase
MAISINWYYADKRGKIGYIHTGKYPIRTEGYDYRMPASGTGDNEWVGILPFAKNPQVYNPQQGYITNWNNKPADYWDDADFQSWGSVDRVNAIIEELQAKQKFTKEEIWEMNRRLSHVDLSIGYLLPFMEEAVAGSPGSPEAAALEMLKNWDRYRWDLDENGFYDSPAQTIFEKWLAIMLEKPSKMI